eukprot:2143534-Pyramimonas_sp.AAC.1
MDRVLADVGRAGRRSLVASDPDSSAGRADRPGMPPRGVRLRRGAGRGGAGADPSRGIRAGR